MRRIIGWIAAGFTFLTLVASDAIPASEIVTGALQDYRRATVIGAKTFGKGVVQTVKQLYGGTAISFTTAKYYTPAGRMIPRT